MTESNFEEVVTENLGNLNNRTQFFQLDVDEDIFYNEFAVGEKAVLYLYVDDWRVYDNFW